MTYLNENHALTFDLLLEHLGQLPHPMQTVETLRLASVLIEDAAYNHARHKPGQDVVQMILLSAEVSDVSIRHKDA